MNRGVLRGWCTWAHWDLEELGGEGHITRPLVPPYSHHTVLLKVESYNDLGGEGRVEGHFDAAGAEVDLALHRRRPSVSSQVVVGDSP